MEKITVLGIDGGFSSIGYSVAHVNSLMEINPIKFDVIQSKPEHKKRKIYVEDDNKRRIDEIIKEFQKIIKTYNVKLITMEQFSNFSRNANSSRKTYGLICAIWTLANCLNIPVFQTTPQKIKKSVCGKVRASKEEVIEAINEQYPHVLTIRPKAKGKHEHCYDAFGSIIACMGMDEIKMLINMFVGKW